MLAPFFQKGKIEAGCDEAGRGCLAGPVVAAAVILPADITIAGLDDSKKLSHNKRHELQFIIREKALDWAVAVIDNQEIDKINILNASILAMHRAVDQLKVRPNWLLIDGNRFKPYPNMEHSCMIKGDARFLSIAAASVLAKTYRDSLMNELDTQYPHYGWCVNKGYPTPSHRNAIALHGPCSLHRKSFRLLPKEN